MKARIYLRKYILGLIVVFLVFNCSKNDDNSSVDSSLAKVDFVKTLGGSKNESGQSIIKTSDGGYAILGHTQSMDGDVTGKFNESFDFWLLKFNESNSLEWQKNYGGSEDDRGRTIIQTSDGGYAVVGYSKSNNLDVTNNKGAHDYWVLRLDVSGSVLWEKNYGFSGADIGYSIIQTKDGGFLLTGVLDVSASNGEGNSKQVTSKLVRRHAGGDYWAIKINTLGEKQWSRYFGGTFTDTSYDAIQTEDEGYLLVGSSDSADIDIKNSKGSYDYWVVKISKTGGFLWEKSFGGTQTDEARAIVKSDDGNYIIVGDTRSDDLDVKENNGAADLWVIKITPSGTLIWERSFGGRSFDVARSVSKTKNGHFIIAGSSRSEDGDLVTNKGQNDAWLIKIDANGDLKWQKTIGGSNIDFAYGAVELNNETIIAIGESSSSDLDISNNNGFTDLLILKITQ